MDDIVTRLRDIMHTGGALIGPEAAQYIEAVEADRDRWRSIAEKAISELENAVKLLETLNEALND